MVFDFYKKTVFSNFHDMSATPFVFKVPFAFCGCDLTNDERTVICDFSEKAFVLCKAAAAGDGRKAFAALPRNLQRKTAAVFLFR